MYEIQQIMNFTNYPDWHVTNPMFALRVVEGTIKLGSDSYIPNK